MQNHLKDQTSPYLLQHVNNPVDWYPWGKEAFEKAKAEDKPIFLSIGYSTCHWCHVMAHESFEDIEIAEILNQFFVSIKVDKEERPDIDSIYMAVCQAFTGSGGWPTTIFLTPEQKPFFAGTYFPKTAKYGQIGLKELLLAVHENWDTDRKNLLESAEEIVALLRRGNMAESSALGNNPASESNLIELAVQQYKQTFDKDFGGFGRAPKFPTPHNLLFLMKYYEKSGDVAALKMVEKTLLQMYRGGMFDHIGGGFSRYSTDRYFLVPHFEKMLYDNALLILAYCKAYMITKKAIYREVAERTAGYILREMTAPEGGFYSAQDADSEGVEGKYYLFEPSEIVEILGEEAGGEFNRYYDITKKGNFEGKNIPNLLQHSEESMSGSSSVNKTGGFDRGNCLVGDPSQNRNSSRATVYEYRKKRYALHLDDKILTSWNGLMIAAMSHLYRITGNEMYLKAAIRAQDFIQNNLCEKDTLYVSYRGEKRSGQGFLDDYANEIFALLALYEATLDKTYLETAKQFCEKVVANFYDKENGGFYLYGQENEQLILRPKETYDGAVFSGNSAMAYNLVQFHYLTGEERFRKMADRQIAFMCAEAKMYPMSYAMFLVALSDYLDVPEKITIVVKNRHDLERLPCEISLDAVVSVLDAPTKEYPLKNDKTTFYVCRGHVCKPPTNEL